MGSSSFLLRLSLFGVLELEVFGYWGFGWGYNFLGILTFVLGQSGNASNILFRHAESKTLVIQGVLATFYPNILWF